MSLATRFAALIDALSGHDTDRARDDRDGCDDDRQPMEYQSARQFGEIRQLAADIKLREPEDSSQFQAAEEIRSHAFVEEVVASKNTRRTVTTEVQYE